MKFNTTKLCLALMGISLLVSLGSALPQEPQTPNLYGTYALETVAPCKLIKQEIETTIKGMGLLKGKARGKLRDGNLPAPRMITIAYTASEVTISSLPSGPMTTPSDGTFVKARRDAQDIEISTKWTDGKLERTFRNSLGQRVNTYSLRADGKLLMQVTATSPRLKRSLQYDLVYTRTTADDKDLAYEKHPDCQQGNERKGRIVITAAIKRAEEIVKEEFERIEGREMAHARKGYDPQKIIDAVRKSKDSLVADLAAHEEFGGLQAYVEKNLPVPTVHELRDPDSPSGLASQQTKDRILKSTLAVLAFVADNSRVIHLQVNSDPSEATCLMTAYQTERITTTNGPVNSLYPGDYHYTISKAGYKNISYDLHLDRTIYGLNCTFYKDADSDGPHPCQIVLK